MTDGACLAGERANDWWYEQRHDERITGGPRWDCNDINCIPESDVKYDEVQNVNYQGDYETSGIVMSMARKTLTTIKRSFSTLTTTWTTLARITKFNE
jgi:hypothetical protein